MSAMSARMKSATVAALVLIFPLHSATVSAPKWKRGQAGLCLPRCEELRGEPTALLGGRDMMEQPALTRPPLDVESAERCLRRGGRAQLFGHIGEQVARGKGSPCGGDHASRFSSAAPTSPYLPRRGHARL